jgi:hypothetical protein
MAEGVDYYKVFSGDSQIWSRGEVNSIIDFRNNNFRWASEGKLLRGIKSGTFGELSTVETLVKFSDHKMNEFTISFYNRGDIGVISAADFKVLYQELLGNLQNLCPKSKPIKTRRRIKFAMITTLTYMNAFHQFTVIYSFSKRHKANGKRIPERYEYLRLIVQPVCNLSSVSRARKNRLKKSSDGSVELVDIPMVDQGQKGYCVAAAVARVLQFYGIKSDQHELAQLINTSSEKGSNLNNTYEVLHRLGSKLGIRINPIIEFKVRDYEKVAKSYDRLAKRAGKPLVGSLMKYQSLSEIYMVYKSAPELLITAASKHRYSTKFKAAIIKSINNKQPVLWSVMLGVIKEGTYLPQSTGGHLRLISGYNFKDPKNPLIIYTDSWGASHERKLMPLEDAWAITTGIAVIIKRD